ncbi:MAG: tRNA (adenosine(37)-N6)-threonylcarbamoyltransferase complex ATPase subunit type 1 TsaE [Tannerellaceae bacterium]|jgi:tRNA threonylcarbamoyladenosine biosynthesis protein TsaE|nr:tRNA (adenosine(37)-N6)-threonylcarbamoyltransferase complex ATPase subunit type 1 TsaE [Tannerellaceae bacterium]
MATITITREEAIHEAARTFIANMKGRTIFAFYGAMGAGKTTFIKAVCQALGVTDTVNSPTFSIINEYRTDAGGIVYHFDFYRINDPAEARGLDLDSFFLSGSLCFVEWPEKIDGLMDGMEGLMHVWIKENPDGSRTVEMHDGQ